jgi:uncharacterized protein YggE
MKALSLSLCVCLLLTSRLTAEEVQPPRISVSGTAVIEVVPDEMEWSVEVRTQQGQLDGVAAEHTKVVTSVLSLLKELKLDEKKLQTSRMEFGENREYVANSWIKSGYYARTEVAFTLTDFNQYQPLWTGLAKISGVSIGNVGYNNSKRVEHRKESRRKALEAAKEKAAEMAKVLGSQIGEPLLIEEDLSVSEGWPANYNIQNNLRTSEDPAPRNDNHLALGTIPVRTRVQVHFRLVSPQK